MCLQASTATWEAASYGETNLGFYPLHRKGPLNGALCWPPSHCSRLKNNTRCCCTACLPHPSSRARQATSKCSDRRVKLFEIKYASKGAKHQWQVCPSSRREPLSATAAARLFPSSLSWGRAFKCISPETRPLLGTASSGLLNN